MATVLTGLLALLLPFVDGDNSDPVPAAEDVTAGWTALLVFLFLILALVVLAFSFVKQLRKAQAAREAGVYGDRPTSEDAGEAADDRTDHPAPG